MSLIPILIKKKQQGSLLNQPILLRVNAGLFDFSWDNPDGRKWVFPDGIQSTDERPAKTLSAGGVVKLYSKNFSGNYSLHDNNTDVRFTGDLADLQGKLTYFLSLYNCSLITGDLADLQGKLTYYLNLGNCSLITGDLADLQGELTNTLILSNCSLITGDLADLQGKLTYFLSLYNCSLITGIYTPVSSALPSYINLGYTGLSVNDLDQTLINVAASAVSLNKNNGTFTALCKTRSSASDAAVATLVGKGWTVITA